MQVTETLVDGLKREFKVVVPATELDGRLIERLNSLKDEVRIKGFRPGKVPMSHLKRLFGRSTMAEIVQNVISEVARNTLSERGEKAAMQPHYELPEDEGEANEVLAGNHDLAYTMSYEVLPKIELIDFKTISVERPTVEVADAEVEEQLTRLAEVDAQLHHQGRRRPIPATASPFPISARSTASPSKAAATKTPSSGSATSGSSRASRNSSSASRPATRRPSPSPSRRTMRHRIWPARKPPSTSR